MPFLESVDDINRLQVGIHNGVPVYVHDVADVRQVPKTPRRPLPITQVQPPKILIAQSACRR